MVVDNTNHSFCFLQLLSKLQYKINIIVAPYITFERLKMDGWMDGWIENE